MRNLLVTLAAAATLVGFLVTLRAPHLSGNELLTYRSIVLVAFLSLPVLVLVPFLQNAIAGRLRHNLSMPFGLAHAVVLTLASVVGVWLSGLTGVYGLYAGLGLILVISVMAFVVRPSAGFPAAAPRKRGAFLLRQFGVATAGLMQAAIGVSLMVRNPLGAGQAVFLTPRVNRGGARRSACSGWTSSSGRWDSSACWLRCPYCSFLT